MCVFDDQLKMVSVLFVVREIVDSVTKPQCPQSHESRLNKRRTARRWLSCVGFSTRDLHTLCRALKKKYRSRCSTMIQVRQVARDNLKIYDKSRDICSIVRDECPAPCTTPPMHIFSYPWILSHDESHKNLIGRERFEERERNDRKLALLARRYVGDRFASVR